jgi:intein/homing endonuclease
MESRAFDAGEEIVTTPEHPFYTEVDGWKPAGDILAGTRI